VDGYAEDESWHEHHDGMSLSDQGYDSFECMRGLAREEGMAEDHIEGATREDLQDFIDWSLGGTWWRVPGDTSRGDDGEGSGGDDAEQGEAGDGVTTDGGDGGCEERPWQLVSRGNTKQLREWEQAYGPDVRRQGGARWKDRMEVAEDLRMARQSLAAWHSYGGKTEEGTRLRRERVGRLKDRLLQLDRQRYGQRVSRANRGKSRRH
jgi:hypothetical protein